MSDGELNSEVPRLGDGPDRVGPVRAAFTFAVLALAFVALLPFHLLFAVLGGRWRGRAVVWWCRLALRLLGVRVLPFGGLAPERPLLVLANHVSWLDILVLGGLAPVSFVARREVANQPVIGVLARLARTLFIDPDRRQETAEAKDTIARRLSGGGAVVLFAEGTSSDGNRVLPFRSALIGAATEALGSSARRPHVQPVALAYVRQHGLPLGRQHRADVAWYGTVELWPHLKRVVRSGAVDVRVVFGRATPVTPDLDRKHVARDAGEAVRRVVAGLNAGRAPEAVIEAERARRSMP